MDEKALIVEGAQLKELISTMTERLREINAQLAECADFPNGGKTGRLIGGGYLIKVVLRDNIKWDQERIQQMISHLPAAVECFKAEYKPDNRKLEKVMAKDEAVEKAVAWARTITPGAPTVTYERLEEGQS